MSLIAYTLVFSGTMCLSLAIGEGYTGGVALALLAWVVISTITAIRSKRLSTSWSDVIAFMLVGAGFSTLDQAQLNSVSLWSRVVLGVLAAVTVAYLVGKALKKKAELDRKRSGDRPKARMRAELHQPVVLPPAPGSVDSGRNTDDDLDLFSREMGR